MRNTRPRQEQGTSPFLLNNKRRQRQSQQFQGLEEFDYCVDTKKHAGDTVLPLPHLLLRLLGGTQVRVKKNLSLRGTPGQKEIGNRGNLHPGVNSDFFFLHRSRIIDFFACRKFNLLVTDGRVKAVHSFFSCTACPAHLDATFAHALLKTEQRVCAPILKESCLSHRRHMAYAAPHLTSTFRTPTSSSSSSSTPSETTATCAIPRAQQSGALAEHPNFTPYGTNLTDDVECSTLLPPSISHWSSSCSLQRHVHGTAIPHGR